MNKFYLVFTKAFLCYLFLFCSYWSSSTLSAQCTDNLLDNSSFENDFVDWNVFGSATITPDSHSGTKAVTMCESDGDQRVLQAIAVSPGQEYYLSFWAKGDANSLGGMYLKFLTSSFQPISPTSGLAINSSTYTQITVPAFIAPPNAAYLEIGIQRTANVSGCIFVDDVCLTESGNSECSLNLEVLSLECLGLDTSPTSDDLFNVSYRVTANNGSAAGFTSDIQGGVLDYGQVIQAFNIAVYNGPTSITVRDAENISCSTTSALDLSACQTGLPDPEIDFYNLFSAQGNGMPPYRAEFRGRNFGTEVNNVPVELYLSTDPTFSANDVLIDMSIEDFPTNAVREWAYTILVNSGALSAGDYYVILVVDPDDVIAESNEDNNILVWPNTINMPGTTGNGMDLELALSADNPNPNIYTYVNFTATLNNTGDTDATGVVVDFPIPNGLTHSSNSATVGSYNLFSRKWNVGTLATGQSATLNLRLFVLSADEIPVFTQVQSASPNDVDSTPGNGTCCIANEDDEAALTLNGTGMNTCSGDVMITSLSELNELSGCTVWNGSITISGADDITNLSPLSSLQEVTGTLRIAANRNLETLAGLDNLQSVGNVFSIIDNNELKHTNHLSSLTMVGGLFTIFENNSLTSIVGLENLTSIGALNLTFIPISTLDPLSNLQEITTGDLIIVQMEMLTDVDAFSNITNVPGELFLFLNSSLENVDGLSNILQAGELYLGSHQSLLDCCGLFPLLDNNGVAGEIVFNDNLICNSVQEVLSNCGGCSCPAIYDPVCGANGVTYGNACEAECAGVFNYTAGECPTGGDECGFSTTYNQTPLSTFGKKGFHETSNSYEFSVTTVPFGSNQSEVTSFSVDLTGELISGVTTQTVAIEQLISTPVGQTGSVELQRLSTSGSEIWTTTVALNAPVSISFISTSTSFEVSDGYFFTGYIANTMTGIDYYPYTIKTDFDGNIIQQNVFPQQNFEYNFNNVTSDNFGNHYFELLTTSVQILLVKTDNNGAYQWDTPVVSDLPSNKLNAIRPSLDGTSVYALTRNDVFSFVKRFDATTGNEIWDERVANLFGLAVNVCPFSLDLLATNDGVFVIAISDIQPSGQDKWFGRFTSNGTSVWQYPISNSYVLATAGRTSDGGFIFIGSHTGNLVVLKTTSEGELLPECGGDGPCVDADCPAVYEPVCGSNGVTYSNACEALCAGITDFTPGECPTNTDGVDLELSIVDPSSYNIYNTVLFQVRVFNNGTVNAENVKVSVPVPDGFVHSSNSASNGSYDLFRETWNAGTIKAGETVILDLNLFALTSDAVTVYSQITNANPDDVDSTPGNGACCTANEDDEAVITVSANLQGGNGNTALTAPNTNLDLDIKTIYPNVATDEITIFVQSKLLELNLRVYNLQGHEVLQQKYQDTEGFQRLNLDVSNLPTGIYLIRFDETLGRQTERFLKMRM